MKISVIPASELDAKLVSRWRQLQSADPVLASPFFCPEFTQVVAQVRNDVEIAIIERGHVVVGLFPFQRVSSRVACPVGGLLSDYHGVISEQDFAIDPRDLLAGCQLVAWDFDHVPTAQSFFAPFSRMVAGSPVIDISQGFEAYALTRRQAGSEQLSQCAMKARRLARDIGPLRFEFQSEDGSALGQVLDWKSRQYRATGGNDIFQQDWCRAIVTKAHARSSTEFSGRLALLFAGDNLVAGHFGLWTPKIGHYWFPAYNATFARYSPGQLLLLKMAEEAASLGVRLIDLGKGQAPYKQQLMSYEVPLFAGSVELPSLLRLRREGERRLRSSLRNNRFVRRVRDYLRGAPGGSYS